MKHWSAFVLLALLVGSSWAFYEKSNAITSLNKDNFVNNVIGSSGHCKNFAPEYLKAAENLKGIVSFGAVDCDNKVQGFPTVKLFKADLEVKEVEGKQGLTKDPVEYQGPRTAAALANWAVKFLVDKVATLTDAQLAEFEAVPVKKALLVSEKEAHSNVIKALALDFDERAALMFPGNRKFIPIAQASSSQKAIVEKFGVKKFPTLLVLDPKGQVTLFDGEMKYEPMYKFLEANANEMTDELRREAQQKAQDRAQPPPPPPPATPPKLWHVDDQASYDEACRLSGVCFIAFLDPSSEDHATYLSVLEKIVENPKYAGIRVLWVDGVKHENFKKGFDTADGFPQAVAFQRKSKRVRYLRSAFEESLVAEFLDMIQGGKGRTATLDKEPVFNTGKEDL